MSAPHNPTSRRAVLGAAAATAVVGLTACATYGGKKEPATTSGPINLGSTSAIPVGGGKIFSAQGVVVTQPTAGTFKAFTTICTHQGCPVTSVANGTINCPCHGSQYAIADGAVVTAATGLTKATQQPLPSKTITVTRDQITVS